MGRWFRLDGKRFNLGLITAAQVLALALWFSGTVAGPGMAREAPGLDAGFQAMLTGAVQAGFVLGTLASAALAIPDRFDPRRVFALSAVVGAAATAAIPLLPLGLPTLVARFATGAALAGIYPVGMKLAVGWADGRDTGLVVGLLVGGLTLGSASPHLVNALGGLDWRLTLLGAASCALAGAGLIGLARTGPRHAKAAAFHPGAALQLWRNRDTRLATLGYLGHMWELYAVWAFIGLYLAASFAQWQGRGDAPATTASVASFAVIAVGAAGCVGAGWLADRVGRVAVTVGAMAVSGACCLLAGVAFGAHPLLVTLLCAVWGVAVVADSAQFSATIAERSDPLLTGTMLTVQTSLGFAVTAVSIQLMPALIGRWGWGGAFGVLAAGPALGCIAMLRLRRR